MSAFIFELRRAIGGNELSWAYVFEWPLFGGYAVYMWRKLLASERPGAAVGSEPTVEAPDDDLKAWNAYLAQAHEFDRRKGSDK